MTIRNPRPGAHNHVEGTPEESHAYVAEMGPDGTATIPAGTLKVGDTIQLIAHPRTTFTVRFRYLRKGHPRAALESILKSIHPSVFETEILDA
jgi:hypothetical protein